MTGSIIILDYTSDNSIQPILIKRTLKKLFGRNQGNPAKALIEQGFITHGTGCDLGAMTVYLFNKKIPGKTYIRMGNNCCVRGTLIIYRETSELILGNNIYIGPGTYIECAEKIEIGDHVLVSMHCNIIDTNSHSLHSFERRGDIVEWQKGLAHKDWNKVDSGLIQIENDCWIGLRSIIMKGVKLGSGTVVAAGSVVTKSTDPFVVVAGNPAKVLKQTD